MRRLAGLLPTPITQPEEYIGQEILSIAFARQNQSITQRKKIINHWCEVLPRLKIRTLEIYSKINQGLFNAVTQIQGLEALRINWGSNISIESIINCKSLTALDIGSSPSLTGLSYLNQLPNLKSLRIENVREAQDLSFVSPILALEEFGICGSMWTIQKVDCLWPLKELQDLKVLWLYSTRVLKDGLAPLHHLKILTNLQCSLYYTTSELAVLRKALPLLTYGTLF